MNKVEYKKINYIFSINNDVERSIKELSMTEDSCLFISKLIREYNDNIKLKISKLALKDKIILLNDYLETIPKELMILRNHIKNCTYALDIDSFNFRYKNVEEDFRRLNILK